MPNELVAFAEQLAQNVRDVQRSGDPAAIAPAGVETVAAIRARAVGPGEEDRAALMIAKRLAYNAAADCWPGWLPADQVVTTATLEMARELAVVSKSLVETLALPRLQSGNAIWLVGAFDLALHRLAAAAVAFAAAETAFDQANATGMVLMAKGYAAITRQVADPADETLAPVLVALRAGGEEDGAELANQLETARAVFVADRPSGPEADLDRLDPPGSV